MCVCVCARKKEASLDEFLLWLQLLFGGGKNAPATERASEEADSYRTRRGRDRVGDEHSKKLAQFAVAEQNNGFDRCGECVCGRRGRGRGWARVVVNRVRVFAVDLCGRFVRFGSWDWGG